MARPQSLRRRCRAPGTYAFASLRNTSPKTSRHWTQKTGRRPVSVEASTQLVAAPPSVFLLRIEQKSSGRLTAVTDRPLPANRGDVTSAISLQAPQQIFSRRTLTHMRVDAPPAVLLAIVWRSGPHTCQYWKSPNRPGDVRLYDGPCLRSIRVVQSVDEMRSVAAGWRTESPQPPTAERREPADRRAMPRSGRRDNDPIPTCAACGLPLMGGPHGSEAACAAAVRREADRLRCGARR